MSWLTAFEHLVDAAGHVLDHANAKAQAAAQERAAHNHSRTQADSRRRAGAAFAGNAGGDPSCCIAKRKLKLK